MKKIFKKSRGAEGYSFLCNFPLLKRLKGSYAPLYFVLAVGFLGNLVLPSSSQAATYYVAKTGSDLNACTQAQPCLTIARSAQVATQPGDIVQVGGGTYNERVTLTASGSSAGGKITFRGQDGTGCPTTPVSDVNHPTGTHPNSSVILHGFDINASYVALDCFHLTSDGSNDMINVGINQTHIDITNTEMDGTGTGTPGAGIAFAYGTGPSQYAQSVTVSRNYLHGVSTGWWMYCTNCTFNDNEIFHLQGDEPGSDHDYMDVWGNNTVIRHNYMHGNTIADCKGYDCHMDCAQMWSWGSHVSTNITFDRNICFNHHEGVIVQGSQASNWIITNNVFAFGPTGDSRGNPWCTILEGVANVAIYNNSCYKGTYGLRSGSSGTVRNNVSGGVSSFQTDFSGSSVTADHNFGGDPKFISVGSSSDQCIGCNFNLQLGSPVINAGVNLSPAVTVDLLGTSRRQDSAYDIGAYEFTSQPSTQLLPPTNLRVVP